ncbi:peptidyl-prolyl cis-trans isomerase slr1251-like [Littorina saxatilis]|uniref:Peptidyl-prolyl cis-trans isomerase n=1 Tax=Littorina saxatilis TaxID=31220 RepID=A0AAN9C241_9CAEN
MAALLALAVMATSSLVSEAAKAQPLMWQSKMVNETISAEATLEFIIKNYDDSGDLHGFVKIGLFGEKVPMTVLNFLSLCNGVKRPQGELKYGGSTCHRLITDMHVQCGDITTGDGNGGISIYGDTFNDENFDVGHSERGTISMSNRGPNTNGSQFFIIFRSMQNLDGRHVAFGQVIDKASLDFLDKLNETPTDVTTFAPKRRIKLVDCSASNLKKPLVITRRAGVQDDKFE